MPKAFEHYAGIIARCMRKSSCGDTFVPVWTLICIQMRMAGLSTARSGKVHQNQWPVDTNNSPSPKKGVDQYASLCNQNPLTLVMLHLSLPSP